MQKKIGSAVIELVQGDITGLAVDAIVNAGIYHFPLDRCARILIDTATEHLQGPTGLTKVIFCLFDEKTCRAFEKAIK